MRLWMQPFHEVYPQETEDEVAKVSLYKGDPHHTMTVRKFQLFFHLSLDF